MRAQWGCKYTALLRAKNAIQGQSHPAATTHTIYMRDHTPPQGATSAADTVLWSRQRRDIRTSSGVAALAGRVWCASQEVTPKTSRHVWGVSNREAEVHGRGGWGHQALPPGIQGKLMTTAVISSR